MIESDMVMTLGEERTKEKRVGYKVCFFLTAGGG
jgi:hypothetical protein